VSSNEVKKVTVKWSLCLIKSDLIKAYWGISESNLVEAINQLHASATSSPRKGLRYSLSGVLDGPRRRYRVLEKRTRVSKYDTSVINPVA
jgi:hypothetical protein